jgi:ATPase subunit of ABC transporter with duplicated ATPase domains
VPSLHLRGLSYAHTLATPVLNDVDLDVVADANAHRSAWVGVVGPNGAGKSTLLRLVVGELAPTTGTVDVQADGPVRLVPQDVDDLDDEVRAFAASWDGPAVRLRRRLALDVDDLLDGVGRGWTALSPGTRKRWQVAAALDARPAVLLLDEPTNHLDVGSRDLLVAELTRFDGLGLLVSHDRAVLETLTTRTLRIHGGEASLHAGAYASAAARWRAQEAATREAHDRAVREVRRERRLLAELRRQRHGADAGPRRERRLAGADQPDAREAGRKFAARKAEAALARRVGQQHARLARAEAAADGIEVTREHAGAVGFHHEGSGRRWLVRLRGEVRHAGGEVLLTDVDVALARGSRVRVDGDNGAGKTSLVSALRAALEDTGEVVASLPQELPDPAAVLAEVTALDPKGRGRVLGTLARLGVDPDRVLVSDRLSPGEARKLALARLLAGDASLLVLDEPTNHLDLPSIEHLQDALASWPGALLLVTHDDALAAGATTEVWHVADGGVTVREGVAASRPTPPDEGGGRR